jgi:hypothetical protein
MLLLFQTPHDSEQVSTFAGGEESALFHRFDGIATGGQGPIPSLSFNRRRTGLPPGESVSSWYPSWMCDRRSCSTSVSFGRSLADFFFTISSRLLAGALVLSFP